MVGNSPPGTSQTQAADLKEIERALDLFMDDGQVTELRALEVITPVYRRPHTESGYFNDMKALAREAFRLSRIAKMVCIVANPVDPDLLARSANKVGPVGASPSLTGDSDILRRRWLFIDLDARRKSGISATDAEHEAALHRAREIRDSLSAEGWPLPILADSGNGAHLQYHIDLPVDDGGLVEQTLAALAHRFDDDIVTVDKTVFNPARLVKLYGTVAKKGDSIPERPHRLSRILEVP